MVRKSWSQYLLDIAQAASQRSTCERAQVGAVIVYQGRIMATGYNGSLEGAPHCIDVGCYVFEGHCLRCVHAEENAIAQAARYGIRLLGATIYTTVSPCWHCFKLLHNSGITKFIYKDAYGLDNFLMHARESLGQHLADGVKELGLEQIS